MIGHIKVISYVLKSLQKYNLFINLKKCYFHKNKIRFFGYIISVKKIRIENEKIEEIKV